MERSKKFLTGLGNQYYRATYKSMGFTSDDLTRPIIGIANSWSESDPGHFNLRQVAQRVRDGVYRAGGTPVEFGVIGWTRSPRWRPLCGSCRLARHARPSASAR